MTFQSLLEVNTYREFLLQLPMDQYPEMIVTGGATYSILVTALTCPSSHRIAFLVSKSQMVAEPSLRAAATNLPDGSKRDSRAPEIREVWTAVGYVVL